MWGGGGGGGGGEKEEFPSFDGKVFVLILGGKGGGERGRERARSVSHFICKCQQTNISTVYWHAFFLGGGGGGG